MELSPTLSALIGGSLIGLSVTLMLLFNGRVTGISGILAAGLANRNREGLWRWMFLLGLLGGGVFIQRLQPELFVNVTDRSFLLVLIAGFLVGYGTVMGSGCTSGHGICGLSRFSIRSLIATISFMTFGFLTVQLVRYFSEGSL